MPLRLPSSGDYAEAAAYLRGHVQPGDAIQLWPPWLEQARLFIDSGPVLAEEDLARADFPGAQRLWLLGLPGSPFSKFPGAVTALKSRGATVEDARESGPLLLMEWNLHAPPLAADLAFGQGPREWHEVQYVSRACKTLFTGAEQNPGRLMLTGAAGTTLHLRAGIVGERAYDEHIAPIEVDAVANNQLLARITLTRVHDPEPAWLGADMPSAAAAINGELQLELRAYTQGMRPALCVSAWTTR